MTDMMDDPAAMTPPQRRREIATILARGVVQWRDRLPPGACGGEKTGVARRGAE